MVAENLYPLDWCLRKFLNNKFKECHEAVQRHIMKEITMMLPSLEEIIRYRVYSQGLIDELIKIKPTLIIYLDEPTEKQKTQCVYHKPDNVLRLKNVSIELWDFAVLNASRLLADHPDPSEELITKVLLKHPPAISMVMKPTIEHQKIALAYGLQAMKFICGLHPSLYRKAIKVHPHTAMHMIKEWDVSLWLYLINEQHDIDPPVKYTEADIKQALEEGKVQLGEIPQCLYTPELVANIGTRGVLLNSILI